jgi:hypothetical protein
MYIARKQQANCPVAGCFGFSITMPSGFEAAKQTDLPPAPIHFVGDPGGDPYFDKGTIQFYNEDQSISGAQYITTPADANTVMRLQDRSRQPQIRRCLTL